MNPYRTQDIIRGIHTMAEDANNAVSAIQNSTPIVTPKPESSSAPETTTSSNP